MLGILVGVDREIRLDSRYRSRADIYRAIDTYMESAVRLLFLAHQEHRQEHANEAGPDDQMTTLRILYFSDYLVAWGCASVVARLPLQPRPLRALRTGRKDLRSERRVAVRLTNSRPTGKLRSTLRGWQHSAKPPARENSAAETCLLDPEENMNVCGGQLSRPAPSFIEV